MRQNMTTTAEEFMAIVGFSKQDVAKVKKHEIVHSKLDSLTDRELAAGYALLVKMSIEDIENLFLDSTGKEDTDPAIQQLGRQDQDGNLDFSKVQLLPTQSTKSMIQIYVNAKPGDGLNLSEQEYGLFTGLDKKSATKEQVEEVLRKVLTFRLNEYRQKGIEGIGPYCRGKGKHFEPGKELLEKTSKLKVLKKVSPAFYKYMLEYPHSKQDETVQESFSWINFNIDGKPTISLVHKVTWKQDKLFLMMHRHFYVSRGHNSVQLTGGGIPVEDNESLLVLASRTSTDQVSGFGGAAKRAMGSRIMGGRLAENLERYRASMEK